ncbi:MAG: NUDIX hydrolase [Paracoccaceae bacterium]
MGPTSCGFFSQDRADKKKTRHVNHSAQDQFSDPRSDGAAPQHAALCWRMHRGHVQVLLITSRETGRWIIPKGWPMIGKSPSETAATEAWEEAGVQGTLDGAAPIGFYTYDKLRGPKPPVPCHVSVFPLRVKKLVDNFPERKQRRRKWFDAHKAARKVAEPELRTLLKHLSCTGQTLKWSAKGKKHA